MKESLNGIPQFCQPFVSDNADSYLLPQEVLLDTAGVDAVGLVRV